MECTYLVDPHQLLCPWFTVVFVLFCIYKHTPDNLFPRPIANQGGGLFWILSDSNLTLPLYLYPLQRRTILCRILNVCWVAVRCTVLCEWKSHQLRIHE
jgi:hypothetical protein